MKIAENTLRRFNTALGVIVILLGLYIAVYPFLPQLSWWVSREAPVVSSPPPEEVSDNETPPTTNRLLVPRLGLDEEILEGETVATVDRGVWHRPNTANPTEPSNMVLVGHRFTYAGNAVFYHLDKVEKGDHIELWWEGKRHIYEVVVIKVVPPTDVSVEQQTDESLLTLYTCTPLWSAKDRLVVQAKPIGEKS